MNPADLAVDLDALRPILMWHALRMCPRREDAEDLVQDTILSVYRAAGRVRRETVRAYTLRTLRNAAIDIRRGAACLHPPLSLDAMEGQDHLGELGYEDRYNVSGPVAAVIAALPPRYREAIEAIASRGGGNSRESYADAARDLQVPVGTVRSRLHRGRLLAKKALAAA